MSDDLTEKIDDLEKALKWSREEERHEISWIGHRLGWLLVSQSFLITAAVVSQSDDFSWWYGIVISIVLGKLGIWLSFRGLIAIKAAQIVINEGWLKNAANIYSKSGDKLKYLTIRRNLHLSKNSQQSIQGDVFHNEAIKLHLNIGWAFIIVWIIIALLGVVSGFARSGHVSIRPTYEIKVILWALFLSVIIGGSVLMIYKFTRSSNNLNNAEAELKNTPQNQT